MTVQALVICVADDEWTLEALHLASALARDSGAMVHLVKLVPVDHPMLLGAEFAFGRYSEAERESVEGYLATLEDYGVAFCGHTYQYVSLPGAIVDIADQLDAHMIFARLPRRWLPLMGRYEKWSVTRQLQRRHCQLHTLETPEDTMIWASPSVSQPDEPPRLPQTLSH